MAEPSLVYLSRQDVAAVGPSMAEILAVLETAFREKGEGPPLVYRRALGRGVGVRLPL